MYGNVLTGSAKKRFFLFFVFLLLMAQLPALDFSFRPKLFGYFPAGPGMISGSGYNRYNMGGGGDLGFEVDFSTIWPNPLGIGYTLGIEGGALMSQVLSDTPTNVQIYSFGGGLGLFYFPMSRLFTRVDMAFGGYFPYYVPTLTDEEGPGHSSMYLRGGGEVGFRFTPGFTVAANIGWRQFAADKAHKPGMFNSGLYAGLTAQLSFQTGKGSRREEINVVLNQDSPMYPVFMQLYQNNEVGSLIIRNNENAEIRDVRVSFRALGYTASEFPCGTLAIIPRGRSAELPLLADFSPNILRFTDKGRILGEVVVRYRFLGQERESVRSVIVATNNRNMVAPGDTAALAAFISPTSPETVDYAKHIAGLARNSRRTGHNESFQFAIWLLEGLRAAGIRLGNTYTDPDEVQFPAETLSFRSGSTRDLALLFAGGLECVGIPAAFIRTEKDFMVAVSLGISQSAAETLFNGLDKILVIDGEVWLPLSMTAFNDGFTASWTRGYRTLNETFKAGGIAEFIKVEESWASYPPAPLPEQGGRVIRTDTNVVTREATRAMQQYIDTEIAPIIRQVQSQINSNPTAALYNRLGILQARAGRVSEGKAAYERAAGMGSIPAMTNRGNLALLEKDYATADRWFRQALARDSKNGAALRGLEKIAEAR